MVRGGCQVLTPWTIVFNIYGRWDPLTLTNGTKQVNANTEEGETAANVGTNATSSGVETVVTEETVAVEWDNRWLSFLIRFGKKKSTSRNTQINQAISSQTDSNQPTPPLSQNDDQWPRWHGISITRRTFLSTHTPQTHPLQENDLAFLKRHPQLRVHKNKTKLFNNKLLDLHYLLLHLQLQDHQLHFDKFVREALKELWKDE